MEYVSDQGVNMEFYKDSVPSMIQSEQAGHPVFVEKDFVRIVIPGSQNTIIEVPADDTHRKRFPLQWAKYQAGDRNSDMSGWKLEEWPAINTAQVKTLKYMNIFTVEQLAGISDGGAQAIGHGGMELRTRARAAVGAAKNGAAAEAQALENQRLNGEIETLKAMMASMMVPKDAATDAAPEEAADDGATARRKPGPKPRAAE